MIALRDAGKIALVVVRRHDFLGATPVLRSNRSRADDDPGGDHHHWFRERESLTGSETLGQYHEIVGKHRTVHIRLEVIESFPVAA